MTPHSHRALLPVARVPAAYSSQAYRVTAGGELRLPPAFLFHPLGPSPQAVAVWRASSSLALALAAYPVGAGFASNPDPSSPAVLRELPGDRVTG
jgi:hypothetical protein